MQEVKIKAAQDVDRAEMMLADSQSELFNEVSCELDKEAEGASVERIDISNLSYDEAMRLVRRFATMVNISQKKIRKMRGDLEKSQE